MPERQRIVIDGENASPLGIRPPGAGGEPGPPGPTAEIVLVGDGERESESRTLSLPFALCPYAAPVGLNYSLADGKA